MGAPPSKRLGPEDEDRERQRHQRGLPRGRRASSFRGRLPVTTDGEAALRTRAERRRGHRTDARGPALATDNEHMRWAQRRGGGGGGVPVSSGSEVKFVANPVGPNVSGWQIQAKNAHTGLWAVSATFTCVCEIISN